MLGASTGSENNSNVWTNPDSFGPKFKVETKKEKKGGKKLINFITE